MTAPAKASASLAQLIHEYPEVHQAVFPRYAAVAALCEVRELAREGVPTEGTEEALTSFLEPKP